MTVSATFLLLSALGGGLVLLAFRSALARFPASAFGFFLLYSMLTVTISVFYLEFNSVFIVESGARSSYVGAGYRVLLFNGLIIGGFLATQQVLSRFGLRLAGPIQKPKLAWSHNAIAALGGIVALEYVNIALSGSTALPGGSATRYTFWEQYAAIPALQVVFGVLIIFLPFVAAAIFAYGRQFGQRWQARCGALLIAAYFLYLLASGQVFNGLFLPITIVFGVMMFWRQVVYGRALTGRQLAAVLLVTLAVVPVVFGSFKDRGVSAYTGSTSNGIIYRAFVLQGSTYWRADSLAIHGVSGDLRDVIDGRSFLVNSIMPARLAASYTDAGVNLQGALPGTLFLALGFWPAALGSLLYGALVSLTCSLIAFSIVRGRLLLLFPASYLWLWALSAYNRSSLETIVDFKFLLFAAAVSLVFLAAPRRNAAQKSPRSTTQALPAA